ncbi:hypothetical protein ACS0TY_005134 [Phlomoides rotata]
MLSMLLSQYKNRRQFRISNASGIRTYKMCDRIPKQIEHMNDLVGLSDTDCLDNLRMNRSTFNRLCYLLRQSGGLSDSRYVSVGEQVALFLSVLSHHSKVRVVKFAVKFSLPDADRLEWVCMVLSGYI